ncbi:ATP-binding protein [Thalassotalea sp. ND16A]|uniref:ATP-binding protein n=1 Tax=Thalassotalea sp. ND16A TaxID=1535422 RepID=UPI00051A140B|nr:ATP-binding protein [Thalassotalea sp. ND16A]KGJ95991.1 hypothetical protein ND16A_1170 [Thalassotalea sp. ND16A]
MNNIPEAKYIAPEIEEYSNHPLINALPAINSPKDTAKFLNLLPKVGESEKALPGYLRRHAMMRILDGFLYPTSAHLQLEQMISSMIRRGYLKRSIASPSFHRNLNDISRVDFRAIARNKTNTVFSSSVIGCSGTGKTTAIEAILRSYENQAIFHPEYQHIQLVWLKIDCPHDGSARSLCIHFFRAVDNVLNTEYEQLYVKARSSAESMLGDIARIAALHSIGLLVIDEIQHLQVAKSGGVEKLLNFFVTLNNVIKVPVLLVGTPSALSLFSPTMRSARRAAQIGYIQWDRFTKSQSQEDEEDWDKFIKRLWKLQWFAEPVELTNQYKELFWEYTQGIPHIAVTLFYLIQCRAVASGYEYFNLDLVTDTYNEELSIIHPMIKALQSGRKSEIDNFGDLQITVENVPALASEQIKLIEDVPEESHHDNFSALVEMLIKGGIGKDLAPLVARQAIEEKPKEDLFGLVAHIKSLQDKPIDLGRPSNKKKQKLQPKFMIQDLRQFHSSEPLGTYKHLKQEAIILDISPYL